MSDELSTISGIAPSVLMEVGEEKEVGSATSKSVYKVKRHVDHYFCSCPAWRNQKGVPTDTRTCKHLKALLGEAYENARVVAKGGEVKPTAGAAAKGKAAAPKAKAAAPKATAKVERKAKAASKAKPEPKVKAEPKVKVEPKANLKAKAPARGRGKRGAVKVEGEVDEEDEGGGEEDEEEDEEEEDEEEKDEDEEPPAKRARTTRGAKVTATAPAPSRAKGKGRAKAAAAVAVKEEEGVEEVGVEVAADDSEEKEEGNEGEGGEGMDVDGAAVDPTDDLAVINGVRPAVVLADEEVREVGSKTGKSVYKVKRTLGHYYCTCPAWRNQKGVEPNGRTCKHIKELLGEAYEEARLARIAASSSSISTTTASKANAANANAKPASRASSRVKPESTTTRASARVKPESKTKKPESGVGPAVRAGTKRKKVEGSDIEEEEGEGEEVDDKEGGDDREGEEGMDVDAHVLAAADEVDTNDELAIINGVKPFVLLADSEVREVGSKTGKSVYKVKRTLGHYYCTCPAWRNQKGVETTARTCKHIRELLGDAYEEARVERARGGGAHVSGAPTSSKAAPASKAKPASSKASAKPASKAKPESKVKGKAKAVDETIEEEVDEGGMHDGETEDEDEANDGDAEPVDGDGDDELAVIDGVKPRVYMKDGEETQVKSATSSSVYKVKRTWDHYYCACPAWRNQSGAPVNARSCKHLAALLGAEYETARLKWKNPDGPVPKAPKAAKAKAKGKGKGEGDGEEGGEGIPGLLLATKWDVETGPDPTGWWISEKLDGVRAYYDGQGNFYSRLGNAFYAPKWFTDPLPRGVTLDGELFAGRGQFQSAVSIVKTQNSPHWKEVTFQVFDVPSMGEEGFERRVEYLKELFESEGAEEEGKGEGEKVGGEKKSYKCDHVKVLEHVQAKNREHVVERLREVEGLGGEGVMLRKPNSKYEGTRSSTLMKVKTFFDAEAVVTGYAPGKGRHAGSTGALQCKMASGKTFAVGSGLSDKQRKSPPKVGSIIVYRFQELTRDGVPRFPTFVGEAADKSEPKDAEVPATRKVGVAAEDV